MGEIMIIALENVVKTYKNDGVANTVLKGISLQIAEGEFVGIIGKSGSGKSTLLNMITGIDLPTSGGITVAGQDMLTLRGSSMAQWRGKNIGVIFQFFQLIPTLSIVENVMLPMDFCSMYEPKERRLKALELLKTVGMLEHAQKFPNEVSGGQQQRVAIARALANDPPIIVADEPTGSLDSNTADSIFDLFQNLVDQAKTVIMVTHDKDLASKVQRTIVVADGQIVNEYAVQAFPNLTIDEISTLQTQFEKVQYQAGSIIMREGEDADSAYIIVRGEVEVIIQQHSKGEVIVSRLGAGHYFGEIALLTGGKRTATIRASANESVELLSLRKEDFIGMMQSSQMTNHEIREMVDKRLRDLIKYKKCK
ncbi:MAG TPA: ATP-binding cassette domain-containing protein [Bacillus bacterium]|nr:ATP-binding cassette domain-containing protein [Bacillus sp. (in: firmicutes)]